MIPNIVQTIFLEYESYNLRSHRTDLTPTGVYRRFFYRNKLHLIANESTCGQLDFYVNFSLFF